MSAIIREKLLSQKDYLQLIDNGKIRSISDLDLRKCKLNNGITLVFNIDKLNDYIADQFGRIDTEKPETEKYSALCHLELCADTLQH